jgi:hypothetical protein
MQSITEQTDIHPGLLKNPDCRLLKKPQKHISFFSSREEHRTMKKPRWWLRHCGLLLLMVELISGQEAFPQTAGQAGLIEGAKKEGRVVWYGALNINDSNALLSVLNRNTLSLKQSFSERALNNFLTAF